MESIGELIVEIALVLLIGLPLAFVIWKKNRSKLSFGEYFVRYGELLAILGVFVLIMIVVLINYISG